MIDLAKILLKHTRSKLTPPMNQAIITTWCDIIVETYGLGRQIPVISANERKMKTLKRGRYKITPCTSNNFANKPTLLTPTKKT